MLNSAGTFRCFFCRLKCEDKSALQAHHDECEHRLPSLMAMFQPTAKFSDRVEKRTFLESFGLMTTGKAEVWKRSRHETVVDVICVDDSGDEVDGGSETSEPDVGLALPSTSRGTGNRRRQAPKLLAIDVASPLGNRLKNLVDVAASQMELKTNIIGDIQCIECYCQRYCSPSVRQLSSTRMVDESAALRYQVTYSRSRVKKYCHKFSFNSQQRREFCRTYDTGLCRKSRKLARLMKPARVRLTRVRDRDLWLMNSAKLESIREIYEQQEGFPVGTGQTSMCDEWSFDHSCAHDARQDSDLRLRFVRTHSSGESRWKVLARPGSSPKIRDSTGDTDRDQAIHGTSSSPEMPDAVAEQESLSSASTGGCMERRRSVIRSSPYQQRLPDSRDIAPSTADRLMEMWQHGDSVPTLLFCCHICDETVGGTSDGKADIIRHYATHNITDISLMSKTTASGKILIELVHTPQCADSAGDFAPGLTNDTTGTDASGQCVEESCNAKIAQDDSEVRKTVSADSCIENRPQSQASSTRFAPVEDDDSLPEFSWVPSTSTQPTPDSTTGVAGLWNSGVNNAGNAWVPHTSNVDNAFEAPRVSAQFPNTHSAALPGGTENTMNIFYNGNDSARCVYNADYFGSPQGQQTDSRRLMLRGDTVNIHTPYLPTQQTHRWPTLSNSGSTGTYSVVPPTTPAYESTAFLFAQQMANSMAEAMVQAGMMACVQSAMMQLLGGGKSANFSCNNYQQSISQPMQVSSQDIVIIDDAP